jgi:hypothetical protein
MATGFRILRSRTWLGTSLPFAFAALLTSCADAPSKPDPHSSLARYERFAGAPVDSMAFIRLDSWQPLDDEHLVVWTHPREAYLLKVWPNCDWMAAAPAIGLTSSVHRVYANVDKVVVPVRHDLVPPDRRQCQISEIRPIDIPAYKRARAAERASQGSSGM